MTMSAAVDALVAHVEHISDLLAVLDGQDPPPPEPDGRIAGPPMTGSIPMTAPVATLVQALSSGNCTLDHLVHVLATQLATMSADLPGPPDRAPISPDRS
ncbi:MAG TPA: hypothetical protein VNV87_17110 [Acidimicrobiales bacterium]|nr:hypothetical protein [Acidimicrobiales bacterium]